MDTNIVVLVGRLTKNAELSYANNGAAICKLSLAINLRKKVGGEWTEDAHFFDIAYFSDKIAPYLTKGKQIAVTGELRQHKWEKDGVTRSKVEVVAENIQLLGSAPKKEEEKDVF